MSLFLLLFYSQQPIFMSLVCLSGFFFSSYLLKKNYSLSFCYSKQSSSFTPFYISCLPVRLPSPPPPPPPHLLCFSLSFCYSQQSSSLCFLYLLSTRHAFCLLCSQFFVSIFLLLQLFDLLFFAIFESHHFSVALSFLFACRFELEMLSFSLSSFCFLSSVLFFAILEKPLFFCRFVFPVCLSF